MTVLLNEINIGRFKIKLAYILLILSYTWVLIFNIGSFKMYNSIVNNTKIVVGDKNYIEADSLDEGDLIKVNSEEYYLGDIKDTFPISVNKTAEKTGIYYSVEDDAVGIPITPDSIYKYLAEVLLYTIIGVLLLALVITNTNRITTSVTLIYLFSVSISFLCSYCMILFLMLISPDGSVNTIKFNLMNAYAYIYMLFVLFLGGLYLYRGQGK